MNEIDVSTSTIRKAYSNFYEVEKDIRILISLHTKERT